MNGRDTALRWDTVYGDNRCPRSLQTGESLGPSVFSSVVIAVMFVSMVAGFMDRIARQRRIQPCVVLAMLGVVQFGAFYVFYRRYQNCDALTGWLFYFVISVAILWVIVSFGLEPAPRPGDDATTTSADPGALP